MGLVIRVAFAAVALGIVAKLLSSSPLFTAPSQDHHQVMHDFEHSEFHGRVHRHEVPHHLITRSPARPGGGIRRAGSQQAGGNTGLSRGLPSHAGLNPHTHGGMAGRQVGVGQGEETGGAGGGEGAAIVASQQRGDLATRRGGLAAEVPAPVRAPTHAHAPPYPPLPPPPPKSKPKGNARPDFLFDIACPAEEVFGHREERCLGTGTDRLTPNPPPPMEEENWTLEKGSGGPTGCSQAWVTALCDDGFLPAVLVLIHTLRKFATVNRDIVIYTSTTVSKHIVDQVRAQHVRVIAVDPFANNPRAAALVKKNPRYASGYWVVKMFVWRSEEYSKMVFLDGDIYMRASPDPLFCSQVKDGVMPISVTPRSSQDKKAGFNAGMFVFRPSRAVFEAVMAKFESQTEKEMLSTSEQDFLNDFFKGRYNLVPIDLIMKHRRIVKEKKLWDVQRVAGYHMNGSPKPWQPSWRTACFYPSPHDKLVKQYEDFFVEWWEYYYEMVGKAMPARHEDFSLILPHDPANKFPKWDERHIVCPPPKDKSRR